MARAVDLFVDNPGINITRFGVKVLPTSFITIDNENRMIIGIMEPGRKIECELSAIIASSWPHIFQFCDVSSAFTRIINDGSLTDYTFFIKNPTKQALHIDSIKIETNSRSVIWIERYCNISQTFPTLSIENYTCSSGATSSGSITIKNSSLFIPLQDVIGIEAHTVQYNIDDIHSNSSGMTVFIHISEKHF